MPSRRPASPSCCRLGPGGPPPALMVQAGRAVRRPLVNAEGILAGSLALESVQRLSRGMGRPPWACSPCTRAASQELAQPSPESSLCTTHAAYSLHHCFLPPSPYHLQAAAKLRQPVCTQQGAAGCLLVPAAPSRSAPLLCRVACTPARMHPSSLSIEGLHREMEAEERERAEGSRKRGVLRPARRPRQRPQYRPAPKTPGGGRENGRGRRLGQALVCRQGGCA